MNKFSLFQILLSVYHQSNFMLCENIWRLILSRLILLSHIGMWIKIPRYFSGVGLDKHKVGNCCY